MWRLFCHSLFLNSACFDGSVILCFVVVASPGQFHLYFSWEIWINLINLGHFLILLINKSILLPVNVCKIAG